MTDNVFPIKYDSTTKTHLPIPAGDHISTTLIQKSARLNNQLQLLADGLYTGDSFSRPTYYVAAAGVNDPTLGSEVAPFQTLDFALTFLASQTPDNVIHGTVTIALKAGETFTLTNSYKVAGSIRLAFYGSTYGDFDGTLIGTGCDPAFMIDLNRPIIAPTQLTLDALFGCNGFRLSGNARITLDGVQINLPPRATPAPVLSEYGSLCDLVTATNFSDCSLILNGAIINITDVNAVFGLIGIHARAQVNMSQFASQFQILGVVADATVPTANLLARKFFIKFYADFAGNNQVQGALASSTVNSSTGSGLMTLLWTETQALIVTGTTTNLPTFPVMLNVTYGMRNYILNLVRDQQQRALNVIASELF